MERLHLSEVKIVKKAFNIIKGIIKTELPDANEPQMLENTFNKEWFDEYLSKK